MPEAHYDGTRQSADGVILALAQAGYQVVGSTPNSPRAATDFWQEARKLFKDERLERGEPRDYRAHLREPGGENRFMHVAAGGRVRADGIGQVRTWAPASPVRNPGISVWQDARSGDTRQVFAWDGTELGFSDLIGFFQINGNLLNSLQPPGGAAGLQVLNGLATRYAGTEVYEFSLTPETLFALGDRGTIETVTEEQLRQSFLPTEIEAHAAPAFQTTLFSENLFRQGILLAPVEKRTPWYKKWWVWVLAALVAAIIAVFALMLGPEDPEPTETPTPTPAQTEEPEPAPVPEPIPEPEPAPEPTTPPEPPGNGGGGTGGGEGGGILPDIEWPWQDPEWQWPWERPDWQWPWESAESTQPAEPTG